MRFAAFAFLCAVAPASAESFAIAPGPDAESALQEALILAQPGGRASAEELARVRAQVIASLVFGRDSITSQATAIGQLGEQLEPDDEDARSQALS